jgi:pimeloyl-ACP methyl ester carboxylesterase
MGLPLGFRLQRKLLSLASYVFPKAVAGYWLKQFVTPIRHDRPGWESEILKEATAHTLENGIKYWKWGNGPIVLLVHGWDGRGSQMGKFIPSLVQAGYQVIAWDGPAHGESPGETTHIVQYAQSLLTFGSQVAPIHAVIGHSFGAGASALAINWGLSVKKVVLIASPSSIQGVLDRYISFIKLPQRAANEFRKKAQTMAKTDVKELEIDRLAGGVSSVKALLFHAPEDRDVPFNESERIARHWKNAKLISVPGAGHRRILKNEEVIKDTVLFLKSE